MDSVEAQAAANPLLAFVHVPKTGGTSLQTVFQGVLMNARPMFNIRHPEHVQAFFALSQEEQAHHYGVFGHMPLGIDRHTDRPVTYITFLRHPVERVLSAYAHRLRHPAEPGSDKARERGIAWTMQEMNEMVACLADHDFVQQPDQHGEYWTTGAVTREHLEQAKANLRRCAFIGLQEHYADDVVALRELKGRRILVPGVIPLENTGSNRLRQSDLTPEQLEGIRNGNMLDLELYEYALQLRETWGGPIRPDCLRLEQWRALDLKWRGNGGLDPEASVALPAGFSTPGVAWHYGSVSEALPIDRPATVRVRAEALTGQPGVCLLSEDGGQLMSEQRVLTVGAGEEMLFLTYDGTAPATLCLRNYDSPDQPGELLLKAVEYALT